MSIIATWLRHADPSAIAIADDCQRLTYGQLLSQAARLATILGATSGSARYALVPAEKSVRFIRMLVAASLSGKVPVPIDPQAPRATVEAIGQRCGS